MYIVLVEERISPVVCATRYTPSGDFGSSFVYELKSSYRYIPKAIINIIIIRVSF